MRFFYLLVILLLNFGISSQVYSQEKNTEKVWRVNFLNPGIEHEFSTGNNSTLSIGAGIGFNISYPNTRPEGIGLAYAINPFLDVQQKWFYNFEKRKEKELSIKNNSGNFIAARLLTRGKTIFGDNKINETLDFAVGPTWGLQRNYGKNFHFLFDIGPFYYFDVNGNSGFFPLMVQINLGFNL